ncbi:hypothetical protein ACE1TH_12345 [Shouchella sp. JSM 1781072]|uniref:hypothetical protein n=1 Tax=Bacillaceae TaxID=186817 RepID=UPI000C070B83|nr:MULTISPECIES: hypothetical protein [Bacillaceae]UTR06874.1 hypothetical protein MM326_02255 [Alkalihalobacillus sp. LMS6]
MNHEEAYRRLNLSEDATDEEIERQYMMWIRKHKADSTISLDEKTEAYTYIRNTRDYGTEKEDTVKDKWSHFFYYYKIHMLVGVVGLMILATVGRTIYSNYQERQELAALPEENVEIMFYGSFLHPLSGAGEEAEALVEENILKMMPAWERVVTTLTYHSVETDNLADVGAQQRGTVLLATERPDLYVFDEETFYAYVEGGMFVPLDQINEEIIEQAPASAHVYAALEDESAEQLFGLQLEGHGLLENVETHDDVTQIAAIRQDSDKKENALDLLLQLQEEGASP